MLFYEKNHLQHTHTGRELQDKGFPLIPPKQTVSIDWIDHQSIDDWTF